MIFRIVVYIIIKFIFFLLNFMNEFFITNKLGGI